MVSNWPKLRSLVLKTSTVIQFLYMCSLFSRVISLESTSLSALLLIQVKNGKTLKH